MEEVRGPVIRLATDPLLKGTAARITRNLVHTSNNLELGSKHMLMTFWNDEAGVIISAELVLVLTIAVLAMVVGLSEVTVSINNELNDISNAFGAINQSYSYTGFQSCSNYKQKSSFSGSFFTDAVDDCDTNTTCDLVTGYAGSGEGSRW
jgi:Flp pilus assembly pilin Flp